MERRNQTKNKFMPLGEIIKKEWLPQFEKKYENHQKQKNQEIKKNKKLLKSSYLIT